MLLFDRKVRLLVGPPGEEGVVLDERLAIDFSVEKSREPQSNSTSVDVYGLSENTRNKLIAPGHVVRLEAGYAGDLPELPLLSLAEIVTSTTRRNPPDRVTTFTCQDGALVLSKTKIRLSYRGKTSLQTIFNEVSRKLGLPIRPTGYNPSGDYTYGFSFSGNAREALDTLCYKAGLVWAIQDRTLQLLPPNKAEKGQGYVLNKGSGLIGSPSPIEKDEGGEEDYGLGFQVECLLNARIMPGSLVQVVSETANGWYTVHKVAHRGSTFGEEWITSLEVFEER